MFWVCMVQPQLSLHLLTFSLGYVLEGSSYQFLTEVTDSSYVVPFNITLRTIAHPFTTDVPSVIKAERMVALNLLLMGASSS